MFSCLDRSQLRIDVSKKNSFFADDSKQLEVTYTLTRVYERSQVEGNYEVLITKMKAYDSDRFEIHQELDQRLSHQEIRALSPSSKYIIYQWISSFGKPEHKERLRGIDISDSEPIVMVDGVTIPAEEIPFGEDNGGSVGKLLSCLSQLDDSVYGDSFSVGLDLCEIQPWINYFKAIVRKCANMGKEIAEKSVEGYGTTSLGNTPTQSLSHESTSWEMQLDEANQKIFDLETQLVQRPSVDFMMMAQSAASIIKLVGKKTIPRASDILNEWQRKGYVPDDFDIDD